MARRTFGSRIKLANARTRARYRINGEEKSKVFSGPKHYTRAGKWLDDMEALLLRGERPKPVGGMGLRDYIENDFGPRCALRVSPRTWVGYDGHLRRFVKHFGNVPLRGIDFRRLDGFFVKLQKDGCGAETQRRYKATLSKLFKWALREGHVDRNPVREIELEKPKKPVHQYLSHEAVQKRLRRLPKGSELQAFAEIAYETGLRLSENAGLSLDDIPTTGKPRIVVPPGKTREGRVVPLSPRAVQVIQEVLAGRNVIKLRGKQKLWTNSAEWFCRQYGAAMKDAGFDDRLHELRHAFGSRYARTEPLHVVSALMGHKSILTTRRYSHAATDDLFNAVQGGGGQHQVSSS